MLTYDLRRVCIEENWYTNGTDEDYQALFDRLTDENGRSIHLTNEALAEIAEDIATHSTLEAGWSILDIMNELVRICTVTFSETCFTAGSGQCA